MKVGCKTPCRDCPWRRNAPAGWLGGFPAVEFVAMVQTDVELACHLTVGGSGEPSLCAGALISYRNQCKSPRTPDLGAAVQQVEPSPDVFAFPREFLDHHESGHLSFRSMFTPEDRETLSFWLNPAVYRGGR